MFITCGLIPRARVVDLDCANKGQLRHVVKMEADRLFRAFPRRFDGFALNFQNSHIIAKQLGMPDQEMSPDRRQVGTQAPFTCCIIARTCFTSRAWHLMGSDSQDDGSRVQGTVEGSVVWRKT